MLEGEEKVVQECISERENREWHCVARSSGHPGRHVRLPVAHSTLSSGLSMLGFLATMGKASKGEDSASQNGRMGGDSARRQ